MKDSFSFEKPGPNIEIVQQDIMRWVEEHIPVEVAMGSPTSIIEALKMLDSKQRQQIENMAEMLNPENGPQGLRLSREIAKGSEGSGDIWLFTWPGEESGAPRVVEGYGESVSSFYVARGDVREEVFMLLEEGEGTSFKSQPISRVMKTPSFLGEGTTITVPPEYVHSLVSRDNRRPIILSGFSPSLSQIETFKEEKEGGETVLVKEKAISVDDEVKRVDLSPDTTQ